MRNYRTNTLLLALFTLVFIMLGASIAHGACLPPLNANLTPKIVASENAKGCWVGWWCAGEGAYIAAAPKNYCGLVSSRRAVAAWASNPSVTALNFGANPFIDPTLRAIWEPEKDKLMAIRPQQ